MKKLLSVALVLVMLLTQLALPSFADVADDSWYEDPYKGLDVESVSVEVQRSLIENVDGYYIENEDGTTSDDFYYDVYYAEPVLTVVYENGETEVGPAYDMSGDLLFFDTQEEKAWLLGKHVVTGSYRDYEFNFEVEVVETPVKSMTAVAQKALVEGWDCTEEFYFDENGNEVVYSLYPVYLAEPVFTITMKDGTVYKGTDEEINEQTGYWTYEAVEQMEKPLKVGKNDVKFTYLGVECECEIEITPNPYESVTISGENEVILEFKGVDKKDSFKTKIISWDGSYGYGEVWGNIVTEDGKEYWVNCSCYMDEDGKTYPGKDITMEIGPMTTNTLESNNWIAANLISQDVLNYSMSYYKVNKDFKGYFSDEDKNIDDLVAISTYLCEMEPAGENEDGYVHTLKVDEVEENIEAVFGLTGVDVKKSSFYSWLSRKVVVEEPFDNDIWYSVNTFVHEDGEWVLFADVYSWETDEFVGEVAVILNDDFTVNSIYFTQKTISAGDVNCDGEVTAVDARLVLQYVAGLVEDYDINMFYADANSDGDITAVDARIILQKVAGLIE